MAVAQKRYLPYPVTDAWINEVRAALGTERGELERLRRYIESKGLKCSSGQLSDLLRGENQTSLFVEPIHEYFKWAPPVSPILSRDAGELVHGYARMTPAQREFLVRAYEALEGKSGDEARIALIKILEMVEALRRKH